MERLVLVAVHGGPGLDHLTVKSALAPLAEDFQVVYFDLRGHGRSDHSSAEFWNMRTWADDLRRLCDALGLRKPVILGSIFGGDEAAAVVQRIFAGDTEDGQAEFNRVCYPLYSGTPGWAEESRQWMARTIRSTDVGSCCNYEREIQSFDPWSVRAHEEPGAARRKVLAGAAPATKALTPPMPGPRCRWLAEWVARRRGARTVPEPSPPVW